MARSLETKSGGKKAVRLDTAFLAQQVIDMEQGQVGYVYKGAVAVDTGKNKKRAGRLYVEGFAACFNVADLRTPEDEGGAFEEGVTYQDFLRILCVDGKIKKSKGEAGKSYLVDASHLELEPSSAFDHRIVTCDWKKEEDSAPLRVVQFIGNSLDLARPFLTLRHGSVSHCLQMSYRL